MSRLRKLSKNRGSFPSNEALTKLVYVALLNISQKWTIPSRDWKTALITFTMGIAPRFYLVVQLVFDPYVVQLVRVGVGGVVIRCIA